MKREDFCSDVWNFLILNIAVTLVTVITIEFRKIPIDLTLIKKLLYCKVE